MYLNQGFLKDHLQCQALGSQDSTGSAGDTTLAAPPLSPPMLSCCLKERASQRCPC